MKIPEKIPEFLLRRNVVIAGSAAAVALIVVLLAFEPVTRNLLATEYVCSFCHLEREYVPKVRMAASITHPPHPKAEEEAHCVNCHLPKGFFASIFAYTHYFSVTDLFGNFRDRDLEKAGDWIPLSAGRAHRVRGSLFKYDSVTCRSCHNEVNTKPESKLGKEGHARGVKDKVTCIECHNNLLHRYVALNKSEIRNFRADAK